MATAGGKFCAETKSEFKIKIPKKSALHKNLLNSKLADKVFIKGIVRVRHQK